MKPKKSVTLNVRLTDQNRERLEQAQKLGFSMGSIVNDLLEKHFQHYLSQKAQELQKALTA